MSEAIKMEVTLPQNLDPKWVLTELEKEFRRQIGLIESAYLLTITDWDDPAKFEKEITITQSQMRGFSGTNDKRYLWTDEGTKKYTIVPKPSNRRGLLFFQEGYSAKTRPGQIASYAGGRFGPVVKAASVTHQTHARNLTKTIKKKLEPRFHKNIIAAMKRGAAKTQAEMAKG